jgi:hypothetical protein
LPIHGIGRRHDTGSGFLLGEHAENHGMQLWQVHRHDLPDAIVVEPLVLVPEHIANADDGSPGSIRMARQKFLR